jgi:hypothetical protein
MKDKPDPFDGEEYDESVTGFVEGILIAAGTFIFMYLVFFWGT